jgi:ribosomal protein S1
MDLHEGEVIEVTVSSVEQFGILVEFEGRNGVVLETNVYWDHRDIHKRIAEAYKPGDRISVKVLVVAPRQFSASIKHLNPEEDPWYDPSIYALGSTHHGVVTLIFDFGGALATLDNGAEVFVEKPSQGIASNDSIDVIIRSVDIEKQKIRAEQV